MNENDKEKVMKNIGFEYDEDDRRLEAPFLQKASTKNETWFVKLILGETNITKLDIYTGYIMRTSLPTF